MIYQIPLRVLTSLDKHIALIALRIAMCVQVKMCAQRVCKITIPKLWMNIPC
jgi:hypothetical protein